MLLEFCGEQRACAGGVDDQTVQVLTGLCYAYSPCAPTLWVGPGRPQIGRAGLADEQASRTKVFEGIYWTDQSGSLWERGRVTYDSDIKKSSSHRTASQQIQTLRKLFGRGGLCKLLGAAFDNKTP